MHRKNLIVALVLLFIGLAAVLIYIYRDKIFGSVQATSPASGGQDVNSSFPLKMGSKNSYVKILQQYLISKSPGCLPKYGADGDWGNETESCVKSILDTDVIDYNKFKSLGLA